MLIPELSVRDPAAAALALARFGFVVDAGLWRLGTQALCLRASGEGDAQGHGRIDHVALTVPDLDAALAEAQGRGIALDAAVTPDGAETVPEFWDAGLRYVYLAGPEGARIELCQRVGITAPAPGQDHVGIPCADLARMAGFFLDHGATPIADFALPRAGGVIPVRFLAFHSGMVELYRPAEPARAAAGHWSRLLVPGLAAPLEGPEGLRLAPL